MTTKERVAASKELHLRVWNDIQLNPKSYIKGIDTTIRFYEIELNKETNWTIKNILSCLLEELNNIKVAQ